MVRGSVLLREAIGVPGTVAGDVLADLLRYSCDLPEITGNGVLEVERKSILYGGVDLYLRDCSEEVAILPSSYSTLKSISRSPYKQEIRYSLQCRGLPRVLQFLGRTEEGTFVFPQVQAILCRNFVSNKDHGMIQNTGIRP